MINIEEMVAVALAEVRKRPVTLYRYIVASASQYATMSAKVKWDRN